MDVNVKLPDGSAYKATCHKRYDGEWWCSIYDGFPPNGVTVILSRTYNDDEDPVGWKAVPSAHSRRDTPEYAELRGEGRTIGKALVPFYEIVRAADLRAAELTKFRVEQEQTIAEICACYEPYEALRMLDRARAALVLGWSNWSEYHGGARKNGAGWELASVEVAVDDTAGVVVWKATDWERNTPMGSSYQQQAGYILFDDTEDAYHKTNCKAAVAEARELADGWLRKRGVIL
jgi:hypothetical protein